MLKTLPPPAIAASDLLPHGPFYSEAQVREMLEQCTGILQLIQQMLEAMDQVAPYVDQLIDYSATAAEWPLNTAPARFQAAIAAAKQRLGEP